MLHLFEQKQAPKWAMFACFFSRSVLDHEFNCGVSSYHILPFLLDKCQKKGWEGATHARYITSDDDCFIKKHIKIQWTQQYMKYTGTLEGVWYIAKICISNINRLFVGCCFGLHDSDSLIERYKKKPPRIRICLPNMTSKGGDRLPSITLILCFWSTVSLQLAHLANCRDTSGTRSFWGNFPRLFSTHPARTCPNPLKAVEGKTETSLKTMQRMAFFPCTAVFTCISQRCAR